MQTRMYRCRACLGTISISDTDPTDELTCPSCWCVTAREDSQPILQKTSTSGSSRRKSRAAILIGLVIVTPLLVVVLVQFNSPASTLLNENELHASDEPRRVVSSKLGDPSSDSLNALDKFSNTLDPAPESAGSIFDRASASVYTVYTDSGRGSGVCVSIGGKICVLTNRHVLESALSVSTIRLVNDTNEHNVTDAYWSPTVDIAILIPSNPNDFVPIPYETDPTAIGGPVFCIGTTAPDLNVNVSVGRFRLTQGIVSNFVRIDQDELIEVSAALSPGMSGGPALNDHGELVGLNRSKVDSSLYSDGYYLVPVSEIMRVTEEQYDLRSFSELRREVTSRQSASRLRQRRDTDAAELARKREAARRAAEIEAQEEARREIQRIQKDIEQRQDRAELLNLQYIDTRQELTELGMQVARITNDFMVVAESNSLARSKKARELREFYKTRGDWDRAAELYKIGRQQAAELRALGIHFPGYLNLMDASFQDARDICEYSIAPTSTWSWDMSQRLISEYNMGIDKLDAWIPLPR